MGKEMWVLLIILLSSTVIADEGMSDIARYAEKYETGKISYLQLVVYANAVAEDTNTRLGKEYLVEEEWSQSGLGQEDVKKLFGEPTDSTNWVFVLNQEREDFIDERLPIWERRLFDGRKVKITLNARPALIRGDDDIIFYTVDFDIRFKTNYNLDVERMISDVKSRVNDPSSLMQSISTYEGYFNGFLEQNSDECKDIMADFFTSSDKLKQQTMFRMAVTLHEEAGTRIVVVAQLCQDCDWPFTDMHFEVESRERMQEESFEKPDGSFEDKSIDELEQMLAEVLEEFPDNLDRRAYYEGMLQEIVHAIDEKAGRTHKKDYYEQRKSRLEEILGRFGSVRKEVVKELRYEHVIYEEKETVNECRELGIVQCGLDEGCFEGECVAAKGGDEDCRNKIDDDGDQIIDCLDPDCAVDCGWICRDTCEDACWSCRNQECQSVCADCGDCEGPGCEDRCKDCWSCNDRSCKSECTSCDSCQQDAWQDKRSKECEKICALDEDSAECEKCTSDLRYQECQGICQEGGCQDCKQDNCYSKEFCKEGGEVCWQCTDKECSGLCSKCKDCENKVSRDIFKDKCEGICDRSEGSDECTECMAEQNRWVCDDLCSQECTPCQDQYCRSECDSCWQDGDCQDCEECKQDSCSSECGQCNECYSDLWQQENPCDLPCKICESCDESEDYCKESCNECSVCDIPKDVLECMTVCDEIVYDNQQTLDKCYSYCEEKVIFYCDGKAQNTPCLYMSYLCDGGNYPIPCDYYICKFPDGTETKQSVFCGQEKVCGMNREWEDDVCVCMEGWLDCDRLGENGCESPLACQGAFEICDDGLDNDHDSLFDCSDLKDCEGQRCDPYSQDICLSGVCTMSCPSNMILSDEYCVSAEVCMVGWEYDENNICVKINTGNVTNTTVVISNETNITVPIGTNGTGVISNETIPIHTNETAPIDTPENDIVQNPELNESASPDEEDFECPDGYYYRNGRCLFIVEEQVCDTWQVLNHRGVCEDIIEEDPSGIIDAVTEGDLIETEDRCTAREDCEDENAICSIGKCKILSQDIINNDSDSSIIREIDIWIESAESDEITEEIIDEGEHAEEAGQEDNLPEEPLEDIVEEQSDGGIPTGNFINTITGLFTQKKCESKDECGYNMLCDEHRGECFCEEYFFDCNGDGRGSDKDGCESKDPTCGGRRDVCRECKENQVCFEELGRCDCAEGFFDCDGDWSNGCESGTRCGMCQTDSDCAGNRCSEWDNSVFKIGCVPSFEKPKFVLALSGGCIFKPAGTTEPYLSFDLWGMDTQSYQLLRGKYMHDLDWCKLDGLMEQRKELESSMNLEFMAWFFEDYVANEPSEWESHMEGIFSVYRRFVENAREIAERGCEADIELKEIEFASEYGRVHYWEEIGEFEGKEIISPYMEIWVFPTKDFMRKEFGNHLPKEGPSPKEVEEMKKNPELVKKIAKLADENGGSADFGIHVVDGDEIIATVIMSLDAENMISFTENEPDIEVIVDFNFVYDTIKSIEQESHLESPPWDRRPRGRGKQMVEAAKVVAKISGAVVSGEIKVRPISKLPTVLGVLKIMSHEI